jgi:NADH-quinone oxidoreductase subunit N
MAGIPPLAGFFAKFFIIFSVIKYKIFGLILLILLCNCISCFYYIKLIKFVFFNTEIPNLFNVLIPFTKLNTYLIGFSTLLLLFLFLDFEFIFLITNLISFSFT